jgi:hypothetical protein
VFSFGTIILATPPRFCFHLRFLVLVDKKNRTSGRLASVVKSSIDADATTAAISYIVA